jgi:hypothetical protein
MLALGLARSRSFGTLEGGGGLRAMLVDKIDTKTDGF